MNTVITPTSRLLGASDVDGLCARLARLRGPALTVYVPPAVAQLKATRCSVTRQALREAGAPVEAIEPAIRWLRDAPAGPNTMVVIRGSQDLVGVVVADTPPLVDPMTVTARWGRPFVGPLMVLLQQSPRVGAVYVDGRRVRVFEIYLGQIEQLLYLTREHDDQPLSSEDDRDKADGHREAVVRRFHRQAARDVLTLVGRRGIDVLVMLGADPELPAFIEAAPRALVERIDVNGRSLTRPDAPLSEVRARAVELAAPIVREHLRVLLDRVVRRGVTGVDATLRALQRGRLRSLVMTPAAEDAVVYRDRESGYVAADPDEPALSDDITADELRELVAALARRFHTDLIVLSDDDEGVLTNGTEGIGGIPRW